MGLSIVDLMTGLGLAYATLTAPTAGKTGVGRDIDVSLFDMSLYNLCYVANWYLNCDVITPATRSAHPSLTPCAQYKTRDGWIFLMCNEVLASTVRKDRTSRIGDRLSIRDLRR